MKKKCKVVMLATDEEGSLNLGYGNVLYQGTSLPSDNKHKNQHLYIVSDDEIKEDDYFMSAFYSYLLQNTKEWRDGQESMVKGSSDCSDLKLHKVIATTDSSLWEHDDTVPYPKTKPALPQIPQQFIEYFVSEYNKGNVITEVMVEFGEKHHLRFNGFYEDTKKPYLKTNQDNTINIDVVKDSYSREEVNNLMMQAWITGEANVGKHYSVREKWIEENL